MDFFVKYYYILNCAFSYVNIMDAEIQLHLHKR